MKNETVERSPDEPESEKPFDFSSEVIGRLAGRKGAFGRYRVEGEIAIGGQGTVLRVWDEDLRRHLAMKVTLRSSEGSASANTPPLDSRTLARFLEEAQITGQLDHPGIVPIHELGLDASGHVYFTMQLVRGSNLQEVFDLVREEKEGWSQTRALGVVLKVCEAMAYAHDKGVIHRDLKPSNVMVGRFGAVYVMDWGLACVLGREDAKNIRLQLPPVTSDVRSERREHVEASPDSPLLTMDGDVVGTPCYMSPEQAGGRIAEVGPPSDVYSVGAILYHLLTGRMPYVDPEVRISQHTVLAMVLQGPPRPVHEIAPAAPTEIVAICEKAMARDARRRYGDMSELADDLRAYLEGRVVRAHKTGPLIQFRKWVRRNRPLAASLAGILIVLAGAGAWRLDQVRRERGLFRSFLEQARTAEHGGDMDRAIELVSSALTLRPEDPLASERRATYVLDRERRREEEDRRRRDEAEARKREERLAEAHAQVEEGRRLIDESSAIAEGLPEKRKRLAEGESILKGPEGPDVKRPLWVLEEEIRREEGRAKDLETRALNAFHGALALAGEEGIPEAKAALADYWLSRFQEAVAAGEEPEANRLAGQVRIYDEERRHATLLDQDGTLTLRTDPPGARAFLFRYVEKEKRLWPVPFDISRREPDLAGRDHSPDSAEEDAAAIAPQSGYVAPSAYDRLLEDPSTNDLGETPIEGLSLPHGSYLVVLRKEGFADVRYPLLIRRGGEEGPRNPLRLWKTDEHPDRAKWVYVPEGRSVLGGDAEAFDSWDRREPYVESFFIGRFEVTCAKYAEFLNDPETVQTYLEHRKAERLRLVPRQVPDALPYDGWIVSEGEADSTRFNSGTDPNWPVLAISWEDAIAYVAWLNRLSEEKGERWEYSLPKEEEWERAARGADGRLFPWGDGFDWTFCKGGNSRPGDHQNSEPVGVFPADESPFGVRDLAGGVWERCQDPFNEGSPLRSGRGGAWLLPEVRGFRSASRYAFEAGNAPALYGFRVTCRARDLK